MRQVPLTKGYFALVDDEDFDHLMQWSWQLFRCGRSDRKYLYARGRGKDGKHIFMHREIMLPNPESVVDHINYDGLDNRRSNLRICNQSQNSGNTRQVRSKIGFRGVTKTLRGEYVAKLGREGAVVHLGTYPTAEDAALAYDKAAREHFGEFATLNYPEEPVTPQRQIFRGRLQRNNTTGFIGVSFIAQKQRFRASIQHSGKSKILGSFQTAEEAARAYDRAARQLRGILAQVNFQNA